MGEDFAPPLKKLAESGIAVAAAPTGGMGLALDAKGRLPQGVLFTDAAHKIAEGTASTTYPGASQFSNTITIPHGLGVIPVAYCAICNRTGDVAFAWQAADPDATNIYIRLANPFTTPAGGTVTGVWWVAIG